MKIDEIGLEVLAGNKTAAAFWRSMNFKLRTFLFRPKTAIGNELTANLFAPT